MWLKEHWIIIVIILAVLIIAGIVFLYWYNNRTIDAGMLRTSVEQQNKIKAEEGYRSDVYADSGGVLTVGYGHTGSDVDALGEGTTISSQQGLDFFNSDLNKFENILNRILPNSVLNDLDQNQWDALVDFLWNTDAEKSDLFSKYVDNEDWQGAAAFLRAHYTTDSQGHKLAGLIERRNEEANEIVS